MATFIGRALPSSVAVGPKIGLARKFENESRNTTVIESVLPATDSEHIKTKSIIIIKTRSEADGCLKESWGQEISGLLQEELIVKL